MSSTEIEAYKVMLSLDVDYVLVIFGGVIGYSGDDINKFLWMVRIAEGEHPKEIKVRQRPIFRPMPSRSVTLHQTFLVAEEMGRYSFKSNSCFFILFSKREFYN